MDSPPSEINDHESARLNFLGRSAMEDLMLFITSIEMSSWKRTMESPCNVGQAFSRQALLAQLVGSGKGNLQLLALFHIGVESEPSDVGPV